MAGFQSMVLAVGITPKVGEFEAIIIPNAQSVSTQKCKPLTSRD